MKIKKEDKNMSLIRSLAKFVREEKGITEIDMMDLIDYIDELDEFLDLEGINYQTYLNQ